MMATKRTFWDNDHLDLLIRLIVGFIFIYASYDKIASPGQFARVVYNYHLLPGELVNLTALILPWVEMICGITLILGIYKKGSVMIFNMMVLVFIVAIAINIFRGVDLECGCFTVSSKARSSALDLLVRDIGLLAMTAYLFVNKSTRFDLIKSRD